MYADTITDSMRNAIEETKRRREIQNVMITVDFDDYGEKELMKMFGGLEELP